MTLAEEIWGRLSGREGFGDSDADVLSARFDIHEVRASGAVQDSTSVVEMAPAIQETPSITEIPPEGICIEKPGTYSFADDITWEPTLPGAAITIKCDGVTLDLNGNTLTVSPSRSSQESGIPELVGVSTLEAELVGVKVEITAPGYEPPEDPAVFETPSKEALSDTAIASRQESASVIIQSGKIVTPMRGIYCSGVTGLSLLSLTISGGSDGSEPVATTGRPAGIFIEKCTNAVLVGCTVENMTVTAPTYCGVLVGETIVVTIAGCTVQGLLNRDGSARGFSFYHCVGIMCGANAVSDVTTEYQGIIDTGSHTSIGYLPMESIGAIFLGCSAENITGCCDDCHGMSVFIIAEVLIADFTARNIVDGRFIRNTGAKATGVEVYGWGIQVENCHVSGVTAYRPQDLQCAGYSSWGADITYKDCTAQNVQVWDRQNGTPDTAWGYGIGFGWAPDPRPELRDGNATKVSYVGCSASNCQVGFDTWKHVSSSWSGVTVTSCTVPFLIESHETYRELSMDYGSESPTGMPYFARIKNTASTVAPVFSSADVSWPPVPVSEG